MARRLTPEDYAMSARQLGSIIDGAVSRHLSEADDTTRNAARIKEDLVPVMRELARCCNEVIVPPTDRADLGAILVGYQFKAILEQYELVLVPSQPTVEMRAAWSGGWFRNFRDRYRAAIKAAWAGARYPAGQS
jgi:hypothetical protein